MPPTQRPALNTTKAGKTTNRSLATPKGSLATPKSRPQTPKAVPQTPKSAGLQTPKAAGKVTTARDSTSGGLADKDGPKAKRANKKALALTAEKLLEIVEMHLSKAKEFDEKVGSFDSLTSKLGNALSALFEGGMSLKDIFTKMDKNGDKMITKMEFRQAIRDLGLMGAEYTVVHVDKLYAEMDADKSGDLDITEMKEAVSAFKKHAAEAKQSTEEAESKSAYWRERAEQTKTAAEVVEKFEKARVKLERMKNEPSAEARLAGLLTKKNLKPGDLLAQMDQNQNGSVDVGEFSSTLKKLGLEASDEELGRIFSSLDKDGGGSLDMGELRSSVKNLYDAKMAEVEHLKALTKALGPMEKEAVEAQMAVLKQLEDDEAAKVEEAEKQAKVEAEKWAAETEAKAKAEEARQRKEAKIREEKEQFEAKIHERRLVRQDTMGAHAAGPPVLTRQKTERLNKEEKKQAEGDGEPQADVN